MKLTINRSGNFGAQFTGNMAAKCDLAKIASYSYRVEITATDDRLSPEGFIIENSRVQSYFENTYGVPQPALSCELIAIRAARDLGNLLVKENISVLSVKAIITGSNGALLSAEWEPSQTAAPAPSQTAQAAQDAWAGVVKG